MLIQKRLSQHKEISLRKKQPKREAYLPRAKIFLKIYMKKSFLFWNHQPKLLQHLPILQFKKIIRLSF